MFAGPSPPPPADVEADGSDEEVIDIYADVWLEEKDRDEDDTDDVETTDEVLFRVEARVADSSEPENVRRDTKVLIFSHDLLDSVELRPSEEGSTEGVMELP